MFTKLYIGGEWVDGAGFLDVVDPGTDQHLATVATASVKHCLEAVAVAADAQRSWSTRAPRERADVLRRAFELMIAERDALAELITRENGKVLAESLGEVGYAAEFFRWFSEEAVRIGGELRTAPAGDKRIMVVAQPVGVSLLVTPWNFPAAMATRKIGPALAAGCAVVLKPSPETPLTALALADLLSRAGVPDGVVNVVLPEPPAEGVRAMLAHPAVRKLSFTGSTPVGSLLLAEAAPHVLRCSMELGGHAPFVVCADADLEVAVRAAYLAKLRNTGASCVAANRFYVHERVAAEFVDRLAHALASAVVDLGTVPGAQVGALVSHRERTKIAELVDTAVAAGARLRTGGGAVERPGAFYAPTVLDRVTPDADILTTEIFGPVAPVTTFGEDEEVVAMANATAHGLMAYVMSADLGHALRLAEAVESGMVAVNRGLISDPGAPFGGAKASGLGREGGFEGIEEYLERKYIGVAW